MGPDKHPLVPLPRPGIKAHTCFVSEMASSRPSSASVVAKLHNVLYSAARCTCRSASEESAKHCRAMS